MAYFKRRRIIRKQMDDLLCSICSSSDTTDELNNSSAVLATTQVIPTHLISLMGIYLHQAIILLIQLMTGLTEYRICLNIMCKILLYENS